MKIVVLCLFLLIKGNVFGQDDNRLEELSVASGHEACSYTQVTCGSRECIDRKSVCDGKFDCSDRSDEDDCGRKCEPNEFLCDNQRCIQKNWVCDNFDDCEDNSDEKVCGTKGPGDFCFPSEFRCNGNNQCVPRSYQCDGSNDCFDGSDEHGCSKPVVVTPPPPNVNECLGGTVQISCKAVGVPMPFINWRCNWGQVCSPPRCTQSSVDGYGVLTIREARAEDQCAYSCEAINVIDRVLAVPDAILTLRKCDDPSSRCNREGTEKVLPDGRCQCKNNVVGEYCDRCIANSYAPSTLSPLTCTRCFCMGVSQTCRSSSLYISSLCWGDEDQKDTYITNFQETVKQNGTTRANHLDLSVAASEPIYWRYPDRFLGNKLTAYGGQLKFTVQLVMHDGSEYREAPSGPLVVIKGNEIVLLHKTQRVVRTGVNNPFAVDLHETSWVREDGHSSTREHFLMTLANLSSILILGTYNREQQKAASIFDVCIDIAVDQYTDRGYATAVEHCSCPDGYVGLSCEDCAPGYERSGGGLYLGLCTPKASEPEPQPDFEVRTKPDRVEIDEGTDVIIRCEAIPETMNDAVHLVWTRSGHLTLPEGSSHRKGKLTLRRVKVSDIGIYLCSGTSGGIVRTAETVVVVRQRINLTVWIVPSGDGGVLTVQEGESIGLECRSNLAGTSFEWSEDIEGRRGDNVAFAPVNKNGAFVSISKASDAHNGLYTCAGTFEGLRKDASIRITVVKNLIKYKLIIAGCPEKNLNIGDTLDVSCAIIQSPPNVSFRWVRTDSAMSTSANTEAVGSLLIKSVEASDSGTYVCQAYDIATNDVISSGEIKVVVEDTNLVNVFIDVSQEVAYVGDDIAFQCRVDGDDHAKVQWERHNGILPPNAMPLGETLAFQKVSRSDSGIYRCLANTRIGLLTSTAVLQVAEKQSWYPSKRLFARSRKLRRQRRLRQKKLKL